MISCNNCAHALLEDYGYSNYTVEGTYFHCILKKHPEAPFDRFYGEDKRLNFATQCPAFSSGCPEELDVDKECYEELSEEAKLYLKEA